MRILCSTSTIFCFFKSAGRGRAQRWELCTGMGSASLCSARASEAGGCGGVRDEAMAFARERQAAGAASVGVVAARTLGLLDDLASRLLSIALAGDFLDLGEMARAQLLAQGPAALIDVVLLHRTRHRDASGEQTYKPPREQPGRLAPLFIRRSVHRPIHRSDYMNSPKTGGALRLGTAPEKPKTWEPRAATRTRTCTQLVCGQLTPHFTPKDWRGPRSTCVAALGPALPGCQPR